MVEQLTIREGMSLKQGERVEVYFNIQRGGFSIVSRDKNNPNRGKVVAYAPQAYIKNATFHINTNKLGKILEKQRKTVYAVVRGYYEHAEVMDNSNHERGYCNPFKTGKFINWDTQDEIQEADEVYFYDKYFSYLVD